MKNHPPFNDEAKRQEFARRFNEIATVSISEDPRTLRGYPTFPLSALSTEESFSRFLAAIEWSIYEIGAFQAT
jgi:hypothetical protein